MISYTDTDGKVHQEDKVLQKDLFTNGLVIGLSGFSGKR